jgi:hypothetical protein
MRKWEKKQRIEYIEFGSGNAEVGKETEYRVYRIRNAEVGRRKTEDGRQRTEDRSRNWEVGMRKLEKKQRTEYRARGRNSDGLGQTTDI